ncbi:MAG: tRNA pseudouridine(55) synthase TruB [Defluviitaleaceae bacterium]|nr:tRNA pseudouridine(55) synthase TruB [Defluviitaleaceae bacterium]
MISGFINVYKEQGYTSHDVVAIVKRTLFRSGLIEGKKFKVGHTGTLDPAAEGVLPVCLGKATRFADYVGGGTKCYRAVLKLGLTTDTQDDTGTTITESPVTATHDEILAVMQTFVGEIQQIPPMYSAVKVDGKKLYEIARKGGTVERKARTVVIDKIDVIEFLNDSTLVFDVTCSRGTYVRTLCNDIGEKLGCGGVMGKLIRTESGMFTTETAYRLEQIQEAAENGCLSELILPIEQCLPYSNVVVSEAYTQLMMFGGKLRQSSLESFDEPPELGKKVFVRSHDGLLCGLHEYVLEHSCEDGDSLVLKPVIMIAT